MIYSAHAFRGEYIDLCAQIEDWAAGIIGKVDAGKRPPYLFGQKLQRLAEIVHDRMFFEKPDRVGALLDQLRPFAELRSDLAHAMVQRPNQGSDPIFPWEVAGPNGKRFWLRQSEMDDRLCRLKKVRKELADQKPAGASVTAPPGRSAPPSPACEIDPPAGT